MKRTLRYFTAEEANALLPKIEPLIAELVDERGRIVHLGQTIAPVLEDQISGIGGPVITELTTAFMDLEAIIGEIQQFGCVVKDVNVGLVDFLANHNGRDVYLCWRYGETAVTHYHDLNKGFNDRKPL